jgi:Fe-S-cluster formation regulator IscX/YfhJ
MKDTDRSRFRTRRLKGRAVTLDYDDEDPDESPESFIEAIRETYRVIRTEQKE